MQNKIFKIYLKKLRKNFLKKRKIVVGVIDKTQYKVVLKKLKKIIKNMEKLFDKFLRVW